MADEESTPALKEVHESSHASEMIESGVDTLEILDWRDHKEAENELNLKVVLKRSTDCVWMPSVP